MGFLDDIGDTLFGTKPKTTTQTLPTWTAEQQELFKGSALPHLRSPLSTATPGNTSDLYNLSLSGIERMLSGEGAMGALDQSTKSLLDLLQRGPENIDQYFTETVQNPLLESFQEDILPAINRQYAPSGFWSSQRMEADQRSREDLLDALTMNRANISYQALQSDLDRRLGAASGIGQNTELINALMGTGLGAGLTEYQYSPEVLQEQRQRQRYNEILAALGLQGQENIVTVEPGSTGLLQSAAQGAASAIPFLMAG